jgi:hypothetical protein
VIPIIPQIIKNSRDIIVTLKSLGIAENSDYMPIFSPLFLLITLSGLKMRKSLNILTILNLLLETTRLTIDIITTIKSIAFHPFLMYETSPLNKKPEDTIFKIDSAKKKEVNIKSEYNRKEVRVL